MATYKYKHLTLDDRITIQKGLKERQSFAEIAASISKDPSTISNDEKVILMHFANMSLK